MISLRSKVCRRRPSRSDSESGLLTAELALGIVIIFFPVVLFLTAVMQWPERQQLATVAAAEAARSAALADNPQDAVKAAQERADEAVVASGLGNIEPRLDFGGDFEPGEHIIVSVTVDLPAIKFPGGPGLLSRDYTASFVERLEVLKVVS